MCINLAWNSPGQRCQRDAAQDTAYLEAYGEALQEALPNPAMKPLTEFPSDPLLKNEKPNIQPNTPQRHRTMKTLTTLAALLVAAFTHAQTPGPSAAMTSAKEGTLVVDVREPDELAQLAYDVPNLVNIPLGEITQRANEIPKDKPVIVVCRSGGRSAEAVEELKKLGYTNVSSLEGGIYAWQEAGMPVKKGGTAAGGCCAGGKSTAAGCGDAKSAANCTPEQKKAGCCSGAPKAAEPAPTDKKTTKN